MCRISGVIPGIDVLRQRDGVRELEARHGADATVNALRAGRRARCARGWRPASDIARSAAATRSKQLARGALARQARGSLRPVINATGVVIHTNLGRAPLADAAIERIAVDRARLHAISNTTSTTARAARAPSTPNR